jgi:hypothetical protein
MEKLKADLSPQFDVRTLNEDTVAAFNKNLRRSSYVETTKRKVWRFFMRLVKYLYGMRLIGMPRNLENKQLRPRVSAEAVQRFEIADVKRFLASLKDRQRLYALLGLNAGMLGVDMASMTWTELRQNNDAWRIIRRRTKTKGHRTVCQW